MPRSDGALGSEQQREDTTLEMPTEVDGRMFSPSRRGGFAVHSVMWNVPPCTMFWSLARVRPD